MLIINKENNSYEFGFEGLKIFLTRNTTNLYKRLFIDSEIIVNNRRIDYEDIIYINELSKIHDFINLTKKSLLFNNIKDQIVEIPIINNNNVINICNQINSYYGHELISYADGDMLKIISTLFELTENQFLNMDYLELILSNFVDKSKLIIIDNVSWIKLNKINNYLNEYNFIVLVNDIRGLISNDQEFETLIIDNNNLVEILSFSKTLSYIETELKQIVDDNNFFNVLNDYKNIKSSLYLESIFKVAS